MAVETKFVMLWEFERATGLRLTWPIWHPAPIGDYLVAFGKYRHLNAEQVAHIDGRIAGNVARIGKLAADREALPQRAQLADGRRA